MLSKLLSDALQALLFRYFQPEHYRYSPFAVLGVLLLLGLVNAVAMTPLLGNSTPAILLAILLTLVKWYVLATVMGRWLVRSGEAPLNLWGYTLATEALAIPSLLVFYQPSLALLGMLWQMWTFLAQAIGFIRLGRATGGRVMLGYVGYFVGTMLVGSLVVMMFAQTGALDLQEIHAKIQQILTQPSPK